MWISDQNANVVWMATKALAVIAEWLEGAQAMVDAKVQDHILNLLQSQGSYIVSRACWLVKELAGHEPTVPAILDLNLLKRLVVLAGWVIGSDIYLVGNSMLKPCVAGGALGPGTQSMPSTQLVNGQMVLQLLQT
jgi:hypothetical protein